MQAFLPRHQREFKRGSPHDQRKKELGIRRNLSDLSLECSRRRGRFRARVASFAAAGTWPVVTF